MLAFSGTLKLIKSTQGSQIRRAESYDPGSGKWSEAFSGPMSEKTLPQNSRMYVAPNGKVFYTGHGQMWGPLGQSVDEALFGVQAFFNPKTKQWENAGHTLSRSSPASVVLPMQAPYDEMKILNVGGNFGPPPGTYVATPTTEITTIKGDAVTNTPGPVTNVPRWFSQGTLLPTGEVLITSGARNDEVVVPGIELPVKTPEIYDPDDQQVHRDGRAGAGADLPQQRRASSGRHRAGRRPLADLGRLRGAARRDPGRHGEQRQGLVLRDLLAAVPAQGRPALHRLRAARHRVGRGLHHRDRRTPRTSRGSP